MQRWNEYRNDILLTEKISAVSQLADKLGEEDYVSLSSTSNSCLFIAYFDC